MHTPTVSFVVPCYKLAHTLRECVDSILSQTYTDFEILIMNDVSPDNTIEVAQSFTDDRITLITNETNLGALRNYNKGIQQSRGKYVWLISADDFLRRPYILEKYVELMERQPNVGFTCCPGVAFKRGKETGVVPYSVCGKNDAVVPGTQFLKTLVKGNCVLAPAALVRRDCYTTISLFPLDASWAGTEIDFIWGGDWYLWCLFALSYDIGYFAEPMVCYREHELSMTNIVTQSDRITNCLSAELATLWMVRQRALRLGKTETAQDCLAAIAREYARQCSSKQYQWLGKSSTSTISVEQFESSLCQSTEDEGVREFVRAKCYASLGDILLSQGDRAAARQWYRRSLGIEPKAAKVYAKLSLLSLGKTGEYLRTAYRYCKGLRYSAHA